MKNEVNRALAAKKKQYTYPVTTVSPIFMASTILTISADGRADMTPIETDTQWQVRKIALFCQNTCIHQKKTVPLQRKCDFAGMQMLETEVIILILTAYGHYDDK